MDQKALKWRCRRGMRELDVVLDRWLEQHYAASEPAEQATFQRLLTLEDPLLYAAATGRGELGDAELDQLMGKIIQAQA